MRCTFGPLKRPSGDRQPLPRPYLTGTAAACHEAPPNSLFTGQPSGSLEDGDPYSTQLRDRVTLAPPFNGSFMDMFRTSAALAPRSHPPRFQLRALGISQEEFDAQVTRVVDEALTEFAEERRRAREPATPAEDQPLPLVPLTKDECLRRFFREHDRLVTGSMLGVFNWATGLGSTRFNFDFNFDTDDINMLNAYD